MCELYNICTMNFEFTKEVKKMTKEEFIEKIYSTLKNDLVAMFTKTENGIEVRLVGGQTFVLTAEEKQA